jgi:hypothetical protein
MAIVKGTFATNFSKRLGKVSFANRQGQNIARQRPASVKNPMTEGQQYQRMIFTTVQAAYKKLKPICDHSFEGYTYGAKSMARFMKLNLGILRQEEVFNANFKGNTTCVAPINFQVSEGSLTSPNLAKDINADSNTVILGTIAATGLKDYTVEQVLDLFNASLGQQLSFISILASKNATAISGDIQQQNACSLQLARVIFASDADLSAKAFKLIDSTLVLDENNLSAESKNTNNLVFSEDAFGEVINVVWNFRANYSNLKLFDAAVILSEKEGTTWKRSSEHFANIPSIIGYVWDSTQVINTYNPKSTYYLNNAAV